LTCDLGPFVHLLDQLKIVEHPSLFDEALERAVEAEDHEEALIDDVVCTLLQNRNSI
jgi:hypothetical protein